MNVRTRYFGSLSPEYALLGFLAEQPNHGYELHQRLVNELGYIWHVSQSQVYNILKRLELGEDISGTVQEQNKLPSRLLYQLTPGGRVRFEAWLNTPTGCSVRAIRVEFLTRLYFASRCSSVNADRLIDSQIEEIRSGLSRLTSLLDVLPPGQAFNRLGLELRITQLSSILEWLERCRIAIHLNNETLIQDQP
jgi:DNA-binding PadR family transcriptional regulator